MFVTNTTATEIYLGSVGTLAETRATTGVGSRLIIGGNALAVPQLRGGTSADATADYMECSDVTNVSSCRLFDANGWKLNITYRLRARICHGIQGQSHKHTHTHKTKLDNVCIWQ